MWVFKGPTKIVLELFPLLVTFMSLPLLYYTALFLNLFVLVEMGMQNGGCLQLIFSFPLYARVK